MIVFLGTFLIALFCCTKVSDTVKPSVPEITDDVESRCPCNVEFTASDFVEVCGTLTNNDACGVCFNPNLGKLRGVERDSTGQYLLNCGGRIQFTNNQSFDVSIKIKDGNGLVQGYLIPSGRTLVTTIDGGCGASSLLCP